MKIKLVLACVVIALTASIPLVFVAEYLVGKTFRLATAGVEQAVASGQIERVAQEIQKSKVLYDDTFHRALLALFGVTALGAMGLAVVAGWWLSNLITAPLKGLGEGVDQFRRGRFSHRVQAIGGKEFQGLAGAMNTMAQEIEQSQVRLLRAERVAAWQDVARRLAHDVKNPLTPIALSIQHLRDAYRKGGDQVPAVVDQCTASVLEEVEALKHLVGQFSEFAKLPPPNFQTMDLNGFVKDVLGVYARMPEGVSLIHELASEPLRVRLDPEQVRRVIHNLITNAVDAMPKGGKLNVATSRAGGSACVAVQDSGVGIPEELLPKIFSPSFTRKPQGSGLGLAIADKIMLDHGGSIAVRSQMGSGTTFTLEFPLSI